MARPPLRGRSHTAAPSVPFAGRSHTSALNTRGALRCSHCATLSTRARTPFRGASALPFAVHKRHSHSHPGTTSFAISHPPCPSVRFTHTPALFKSPFTPALFKSPFTPALFKSPFTLALFKSPFTPAPEFGDRTCIALLPTAASIAMRPSRG
eukprot:3673986-Prymnesium_polylepis.1